MVLDITKFRIPHLNSDEQSRRRRENDRPDKMISRWLRDTHVDAHACIGVCNIEQSCDSGSDAVCFRLSLTLIDYNYGANRLIRWNRDRQRRQFWNLSMHDPLRRITACRDRERSGRMSEAREKKPSRKAKKTRIFRGRCDRYRISRSRCYRNASRSNADVN